MSETISVLIAHPKNLAAELLADAFSGNSHFSLACWAKSSVELFAALETTQPDVALISARLDESPLGGFDALIRMRAEAPAVKAIMLLEESKPELVVDAFRSGAKGVFCTTHSDFELLCKCAAQVHVGQIWANSEELNWAMQALESSSQSGLLRVVSADGVNLLSKREQDVVRLLMDGLSNRDMARNLNLSEHTIKNYLFRIFDKLGVSSRTELLLYALGSTKSLPLRQAMSPAALAEFPQDDMLMIQSGPGN